MTWSTGQQNPTKALTIHWIPKQKALTLFGIARFIAATAQTNITDKTYST